MNEEVSSSRLHTFLRKYMARNMQSQVSKIMSIYQCGITPIPMPHVTKGVYILANEEEGMTFGTTHCNSSWACPKCTAKVMAKYGERIACAIEALAKKKNYAMMFTMTVPHLPYMKCQDTYQVLQDAYRQFTKSCKTKITRHFKKKDGTTSTYKVSRNIVNTFFTDLEIEHSVRVYEMTYGENSWHPHIHGLWWTHNKNWHKIKDYEEKLFEYWWQCIENQATKYWTEKYKEEPEKAKKILEETFINWRKYPKTGHRSFFLSKDSNGEIRKAKSSYYICGWSTNHELSGLEEKKANEGHMTPHQILEEASLTENLERQRKLMGLYIEYALETKGHCRFYTSKGLNKIIDEWQQTEEYYSQVKKKATEKIPKGKYKFVIFFFKEQWLFLSNLDLMNDYRTNIIADILELARAPDGREKIIEYCLAYGVDISNNPTPSDRVTNWIEALCNNEKQKLPEDYSNQPTSITA